MQLLTPTQRKTIKNQIEISILILPNYRIEMNILILHTTSAYVHVHLLKHLKTTLGDNHFNRQQVSNLWFLPGRFLHFKVI